FCVIPHVPAHRGVADTCCMEMQTGIIAWRRIVNELLLPRCCDQMHCRDLFPRQQAMCEIDGVPLHARELTRRRCERDGNFHASTSVRAGECWMRAPMMAMNQRGSERSKGSVSAKPRTMTNSSMPRNRTFSEGSERRRR